MFENDKTMRKAWVLPKAEEVFLKLPSVNHSGISERDDVQGWSRDLFTPPCWTLSVGVTGVRSLLMDNEFSHIECSDGDSRVWSGNGQEKGSGPVLSTRTDITALKNNCWCRLRSEWSKLGHRLDSPTLIELNTRLTQTDECCLEHREIF